jgi:glycosyltransferase involved in cell wall biosynthesis
MDGLLVPAGNVGALSEAIRKTFDDQPRVEAMGSAARERALAWPTWEETGERFLRVLTKLVT